MDSGNYIKQLLQEKQSVILPGFGILKLADSQPELTRSVSKLSPPGIKVKFDASISRDDEELSAVIASGESISEEEAKQRVLEFVDEIRFALDKGDVYKMPGVGTFFRDEDQKIQFEADKSWIIDPEQFGLDTIELLELEDENGETVKSSEGEDVDQETAEQQKDPLKEATAITAKEAVAAEISGRNRRRVSKTWRVIWIVTASLAVVLIVMLVIPVNEDGRVGIRLGKDGIIVRQNRPSRQVDQGTREEQIVEQETEQETELATGEGSEEITDQAEQEISESDESLQKEVPSGTDLNNNDDMPASLNKFFIIAGSFKSLQNASDLQDQLVQEGFQSDIIITENRMYRVSLNSYTTKREAIDALNILRQDSRYANFWVLAN